MKTAEIRELTDKELTERIETEKINLVRTNMNHVISPLDNPMHLRHARRLIAKLQTELRQRQLSDNHKS